MNLKKVDSHKWLVESRSNPEYWYEIYYKNCGGHCTCRGFHFNHWCAHLEAVKAQEEIEEVFTEEERLFNNEIF